MGDIGCRQPIINSLLHPNGHGYSPNMTRFANQIDDGPMILATLEMI